MAFAGSANKRRCAADPAPAILISVGAIAVVVLVFAVSSIGRASSSGGNRDELEAAVATLMKRDAEARRGRIGSSSGYSEPEHDGADAITNKAFVGEVLDSLDRIERLSKGILKTQLQADDRQDAPRAVEAETAAQATTSRNAVLGMAKSIDFNLLYRFVRSLRESATQSGTDLILFTDANQNDADFSWLFKTYSVTVVPFDVEAFPAKYKAYHPSSYRWILMRDWMKALPEDKLYDAVFFTDVRDTIFQRNPFDDVKENGFYAFLEAKPGTIRRCGWNAGWVRDCFGEAGLNEVGDQIISCSGTSMATWKEALAYADLLADELLKNSCERNGVDQGMHNYFVHGGKLSAAIGSDVKLISNEEGWIATVQSMPSLQRDKAGYVLNGKNDRVAVVHQYDRSGALKQQYDRQFVWLPDNELNNK